MGVNFDDEARTQPRPEPARAEASPVMVDSMPSEKPLKGPALAYLRKLLTNIDTMLSYTNSNGIALPDDLRNKIAELLKSSAVGDFSTNSFSDK
jgi:hypothetical protein